MPTIHTVFQGTLAALAVAALALTAPVAAADTTVPAHGRGWELITPPDPNGVPVSLVFGVDPTGERVAYGTVGPPPGAQSGALLTPSLAARTANGWTDFPVASPFSVTSLSLFSSPALLATNRGMTAWIWSTPFPFVPGGPPTAGPANSVGLYSTAGGGAVALIDSALSDFELAGASPDLGRLLFQTSTVLVADDVRTSGKQVYELTPAGLRLFGVDGGGTPLSACGAIVGSTSYPPNPISSDVRRVFLSSPDAACGSVTPRVYLRENGLTTDISSSRCTRGVPACNAASAVRFMGATPSGSVAFLATAQQLTNDDTDSTQDLYRYEVGGDVLSRMSASSSGSAAAIAPTAAYPSSDGSRVYFVATGVLAAGAPGGGPKIYLADDDGLRYVAQLASNDSWAVPAGQTSGREDVQLTPDGSRLLFMTTVQLTADDTDGSADVYLYDADADQLTRISGMGAGGNAAFAATIAQGSSAVPLPGYPRRSLSEDGRRVFFSTAESLLPADVNSTADVYAWEDGDLGLVSSGAADSHAVRYNTASPTGDSVFFTTDASLTWDDDDAGYPDLYVARVGGGFPAPPTPPTSCKDGCPAEPIARLQRPPPASAGSVGESERRRLAILPVSAAARRRMAETGNLTLTIDSAAPGRIAVRVRARLGGRARKIAGATLRVRSAGEARARLRLSADARHHLSDGRPLSVRITARRTNPARSTSVLLRLDPRR